MQYGFFLGANSKHGFHSLYDDLINLDRANSVYIIKGSPGCGKSSFMRRIKGKLEENGLKVEQIFCSSDPDSLDGIVIDSLGVAFVDGTSPHVVEPKFPIAVEKYINLGDFADTSAISQKKSDIITITKKYRESYGRVYTLLGAAGAVESELFDIALGGINVSRLRKKAAGIVSREIRTKGNGGEVRRRFLSAISPKGCITLFDTVRALAERIFVLEDNFGLGMFLLQPIADAAKQHGFDTYLAYSPLMPERLEHVIIPELSLAFVTSKKLAPFEGEYARKVRIDAMIDASLLREKKKKLAFSKKLCRVVLDEACSAMRDAKLIHDDIELLYNPHINFEGVYSLADEIADALIE